MKLHCVIIALFLVPGVILPLSAFADDGQVPLFTNDDLMRYREDSQTPVRTGERSRGEVRVVKDKDAIFRENDRSVGVVAAYDAAGKAFSHGSGFVVSDSGSFVTSYHILSNASSARVMLGGRVYEVEGVLFSDRENDIILLKISGTGLPAVKSGDSRETRPAERVYLMDNLQGTGNRIAEGEVSGVKDIAGKRMLQVALSFSGGSSGGPIFNQYGEVIGLAAMVVNDGKPVSFAVPIETVKDKYVVGIAVPLQEVLRRDSRQAADYWTAVADGHSTAGRDREARDAYRKAIEADPDSSAAYNGIGVIYARMKQYPDAVNAYQMALKRDPDSAWTLSNLGLAYIEMKRYREAIDALQQAVKAMPDLSVAHFNLGIAYANVGRYREAADSYKEAIRLSPSMADAHYSLGLAYLSLHDRKSALRQHEILQQLDPEQARKLWDLIRE
jgi:Tfp pilus assembly protein PilF